MRISGILHRGRKGTSTILGTIVFVGILFTSVVPMFLVIRQADTMLEKRKFELGRLDEEGRREDIYLYVSPSQDPPELNVKVENKGESAAKIVRLWINDDPVPLDYTVQPMSGQNDLGAYPVAPVEGSSYFVTVTTDTGNSVAFDTPLTWVDEFTGWETDVFSVNVLVSSLPGQEFKIVVTGPTSSPEPDVFEGMTEKFDPKFFIVNVEGTYLVEILRGSKTIYVEEAIITWPDGSPVVWVFA